MARTSWPQEHIVGTAQPYVTRFVSGGRDPGSLADLLGAGRHLLRGWSGTGLV